MGRCETAGVWVGFCMLLVDLLNQMNAENVKDVYNIMSCGVIEDMYHTQNDEYQTIIDEVYANYDINHNPNAKSIIEECRTQFARHNLQEVTIPIIEILSTERYGYNRDGTNANCRSLVPNMFEFERSNVYQRYKPFLPPNYQVVLMVIQKSG